MAVSDIPGGFEPLSRRSPLTEPWQPLYARRTDKAVTIGLRLATPHTNSRGLIHGGLIAALTDAAMGYSCAHLMGGASSLVTVGLAVDFIGTAQIGQWLAVESDVIKTGSTICFAQCLATADGAVIARANATFRVVPKKEQAFSLDDRFHKTDHNSTFVESDQARISQGHLTTSVPANIRFEPRKRPTS